MRVSLQGQPSYTVASCILSHGETIHVERGAMTWMSDGLRVSGGVGAGGVGKALMRRQFGQEQLILARYTAEIEGAYVAVAPATPGDITVIDIRPGSDLRVQAGAFIAASDGVELGIRASVTSAMLGEGLAVLHATGSGSLIVGSYGAIIRQELGREQMLTVDTGHLVAWSNSIQMRPTVSGGMTGAVLSGEGFVADMHGPGLVLLQTRSQQMLQRITGNTPGR
jgi:uncharacterized protein (TIGR00266 family)